MLIDERGNYVPPSPEFGTPPQSGGGAGSPEGVEIGSPFDTWFNTDDDSTWIKETGVGTKTGWVQASSSGGGGTTPTGTGFRHVTSGTEDAAAVAETGTGSVVRATTPTLVTPVLGVATATSINGSTIPTSKTLVVTTDTLAVLAATTSAQLAGVVSDETGSDALVFANTPTLVTPVLGVATATSINGSTIPTSKTLVVTTDTLAVLAASTSAQLAGVLSDETGTGVAVFNNAPTFLGTSLFAGATFSGTVTLGLRSFAANAGVVIADDMQITGSVLSASTPVGYSFNIDGAANLNLRALADGAGAVTNRSVEIPSGTLALIPGLSYNVTQVGNITTGEDNLMTYAVPAALLAANGDHLKITVAGSFAANANSKQIKVYFGATVLFTTGALLANAGDWVADVEIIRTGATTQLSTVAFHSSNALLLASAAVTTSAETLANSITFKCTGEAVSTDDITQKTFTARLVKTP